MDNESSVAFMVHKYSGNADRQATHAYFPIIAIHGKEVGVCIMSHVKLITNVRRPVSVKFSNFEQIKFSVY